MQAERLLSPSPPSREPAGEALLERSSLVALLGVEHIPHDHRCAIDACLERVRVVEARRDIVRERQSGSSLQIILQGWAFRYRLTADGGRHISQLLIANDFCDLDAVLGVSARCGVTAATSCQVASVSRDGLHNLAKRIPALAIRLAELAMRENAILTERTVSLGRRPAHERLAHLMCEIAWRVSPPSQPPLGNLDFPLTQEQLADILGLTSVHVNRMLRLLRMRGLIELHSGRLNILDWKELATVAGFDSAYLES